MCLVLLKLTAQVQPGSMKILGLIETVIQGSLLQNFHYLTGHLEEMTVCKTKYHGMSLHVHTHIGIVRWKVVPILSTL